MNFRRTLGLIFALATLPICTSPVFANDLEERIAELEATTARKGNRKVSLTISGWVNEAVFFWDDGVESNAYVGTDELEQSRVRFVGDAKIQDGWGAGYILELGINGASSKSFSQTNPGASSIALRKAAWYVKSKTFGTLWVGRTDTATYHILDNIDQSMTRNVSDYEAAGVHIGAFRLRSNGAFIGTSKWTDVMTGFNNATAGQSGLRNDVRYDSPEIAGVILSTSWGSDDEVEVGLRHKGELGDVKYSVAIGYGESTDSTVNTGICTRAGLGDCKWLGLGLFAKHDPTGLFIYAGYGENEVDLSAANKLAGKDETSDTNYIQGGIERKWIDLGRTNVFVEYRRDNSGFEGSVADGAKLDMWAGGVIQQFEAADTLLYAFYRHYDGEIRRSTGDTTELDALDMVVAGAKVNF